MKRLLLSLCWSACWLAATGLSTSVASASRQRSQAPGVYRMMVGDIEVTALNDGTDALPVHLLFPHVAPKTLTSLLAREYQSDPMEVSFNAFLINTGSKLVLIDTGCGALDGAAAGHLLTNLRAAGYQPEQVDEVYLTHMHWDHVGGLVVGGQRMFPNALVRAARAEADYWLSAERKARAPKEQQANFQHAGEMLGPYVAAGRFSPFDGNAELLPGITARSTPGHTPGHTSYMIESQGAKLLVLGDLVHVAAVEFPRPALAMAFDSDVKAGSGARAAVFAEAAAQGYWLAGAHLSFPGIGHLRAEGAGYRWIPINYSTKF